MHAPRLWLLLLGLLLAGSQGHLEDLARRTQPAAGSGGPSTQEGLPSPTAASTARGAADPSLHTMDVQMPGVRPHMEDQYICTSAQMPAGTEYIINFEALATADRAHHLLVYGCHQPASISPWDCQRICQEGKQQILYAWARNAPPTRMPPDVGFQVGGEGVKTLVLQIHYKRPIAKTEEADHSGVRLTLSKQRQKYIAGIFLLLRYDLVIPPHRAVTHGDVSCKYNGPASLYPFGFRVHAHTLSPVISAYFNNGNWSLLGKGNPQWPQAFYPIQEHKEIKPGDLLFARCTYDSTNRDTTTHIGGRHTDEMCNFYMMYYTDSRMGQTFFQCNGNTYKDMFQSLPAGNDQPPPPNRALEEQAEGHHHHPPHQVDQGNHGSVAEGPVSYGRIGDLLRGQLTDRPRAPTNPRNGFLRLYDRDDTPPSRFDYYSDFLGDDSGTDKSADPDYFYYEVQHQRSRNRNRKPHRDRGRSGVVGSDQDDQYRGDSIHGMDGAHAFFGFPDVKATEDSDYPAGQSQWGWRDPVQRTNPYGQEQGLRVGAADGLPERAYGGAEVRRPPAPNNRYDTDSRLGQQVAAQTGGGGGAPSGRGRLRNQLSRGRLGGGGGVGRGGAWANASPTKPPLQAQTKEPTLNPALVTAAHVVTNKEVSSLSSSATVEEAAGWPASAADDGVTLGQVAGVGVDSHGNVHVFHRASRVWDSRSFDGMNRFKNPSEGPIKENTIITYNPQGKVIKQWGANMFYMPHGLHVDDQDNIWVTDVALHQIFKFPRDSNKAAITLGTKLVPGKDDHHFCKPTDVATLSTGEFFVTDGYCNQRVLKYSKEGALLKEWGTVTKMTKSDGSLPPNSFDIPHSVTVAEKRGWVCVADRENGRVQCFTMDGVFVKQFHPKEFYGRLFAVTYSAVTDTLYAVNGPDLYNNQVPVKGFSLHPDTGRLMEIWAPKDGFHNPHDLAVSPQGDFIYVTELDPHKVWRMYVHIDILQGQKDKKAGPLSHPSSVDGSAGGEDVEKADQNDLGASLVIGSLLVVPVIFIVGVTIFLRLRKNGRFAFITTMMYRKNRNRRFNLGTLLSRTKGFNRINTDDASDHELDHLNSDSDVEEYSATTRKA